MEEFIKKNVIDNKHVLWIHLDYKVETFGELVLEFEEKNFKEFKVELFIRFKNKSKEIEFTEINITSPKIYFPIGSDLQSINDISINVFNEISLIVKSVILLVKGKEEKATWKILPVDKEKNDGDNDLKSIL